MTQATAALPMTHAATLSVPATPSLPICPPGALRAGRVPSGGVPWADGGRTDPAAPLPPVTIQSELLGPLSVSPTEVIGFPAGIFGFPECRSFVLVPATRDGAFWLQSVDYGALAFLLVDPFLFFNGYAVDLPPVDLVRLGTKDPTDVVVLAIVTLPGERSAPCTVNLQGPLVIDLKQRRGHQMVLADGAYGTREPLAAERLRGE